MEISPVSCKWVSGEWQLWCGITPWNNGLDELEQYGFKVIWYCGYPRSKSAIPLCFTLIAPDGTEFNGSRLKDIKRAIQYAKEGVSINEIKISG